MKSMQKTATGAFLSVILATSCSSPPPPQSAQAQVSESAPQETKPDIGAWTIQTPQINPMDGTKTQLLSTGPLGVSLVLCFENGKICSGSSAGVFIAAPCVVESNVSGDVGEYERRIRVRFDTEKPQSELWGIVDDRKGILPLSDKNFLAELYKHKQLMVEFGCDAGDQDVFTYDIHNLQQAMESAGLKP